MDRRTCLLSIRRIAPGYMHVPLKPKPEVAERLVFMENAVHAVTVQIQVLEEFRNFLNVPKEI